MEQADVATVGTGGPAASWWTPGRLVAVLAAAALVLGAVLGGTAGAVVVRGGGPVPSPSSLLDGGPFDRGPLDPDDPIDGVVTYEGLSLQHSDGPVDYEQVPPVGGDHAPVWQDCGFYPSAVVDEQAVHSLEHGAVWVTYDPDLPEDQQRDLQELAAVNGHLLVSARRGLPSPVVASAWGVQLQLGSTGDRRLPAFVARYQQGPQTPEPGAPCSGGTSALPAPPTGA